MSAKTEILGRVRDALGDRATTREADYEAIARAYDRSGTRDLHDRLRLLVERLEGYDASVHRCRAEALPTTIGRVLEGRGKGGLVIPEDVPREWLPPALEFVPDTGLSALALDRSEGVLTGCTVAIALTGTIVLRHAATEGRRALTLIPDYHLCVVREDQVVETVAEGLDRASTEPSGLLTTISGPSSTADIEMTRIKGVHGPRTLDVILVAA